jgi:hypothetical protein
MRAASMVLCYGGVGVPTLPSLLYSYSCSALSPNSSYKYLESGQLWSERSNSLENCDKIRMSFILSVPCRGCQLSILAWQLQFPIGRRTTRPQSNMLTFHFSTQGLLDIERRTFPSFWVLLQSLSLVHLQQWKIHASNKLFSMLDAAAAVRATASRSQGALIQSLYQLTLRKAKAYKW